MGLQDTLEALAEMGPAGIARFEESLDLAWIEQALETTGKASVRRRKMPAEQADPARSAFRTTLPPAREDQDEQLQTKPRKTRLTHAGGC